MHRLQTSLSRFKNNDFLRHNAIFFVGSLVVAATNYLYYPIVGRLTTTTQFGEIQALASVFTQVALLLSVIGNVVVNVVANAENKDERNALVLEFGRLASFGMLALVVIACIFVEPLKHFLNFDDTWPFVILGASLVASAMATGYNGFLRGVNAYGRLSIANLITAFLKLVASFVLVLIGFGTNGAIGGLVVAQAISLIYMVAVSRKLGLHRPKQSSWWRLPDMKLVKPELPYASLVLIVSIVTTVLFSIDVILAKHYFSPHDAGLYAGIATIARIIYYVTGSVAIVLLSSIQIKKGTAHNRRVLLRSGLLTVALGGSALLAFSVAPRFFINLLIGSQYVEYANLLPLLSMTLFVISIINLVFSYDLALRRWSIAYIAIFGSIVTAVVMVQHHGTPRQMVESLLIGSIFTLSIRAIDSVRRRMIQ